MAENNTWNSAVTIARNENPNVNMGFARKGTPLYERAKEIQASMTKPMGGSASPQKTRRSPKPKAVVKTESKPMQRQAPVQREAPMYEDHRNGGIQEGLKEEELRTAGSAMSRTGDPLRVKKPFQGFKVRLGGGVSVAEQKPQKMISVSSFRDYFAQRK